MQVRYRTSDFRHQTSDFRPETVEKHLQLQPDVETRNRKPMRPNPVAPWELRVGCLRVYYDFESSPQRVVYIQAIGLKDRNSVKIGGEVIKL